MHVVEGRWSCALWGWLYCAEEHWRNASGTPKWSCALWGWLWCVSVGAAWGADWPTFRGPDGNGHAVGELPLTWTSTANVAWKVPLAGEGWSSPVVASTTIYLTAAVAAEEGSKSYSLRTLALDSRDGRSLWNTEVFHEDGATAPKIHAKNSHASPTPIVDGDRIFVHFGHQGTACLQRDGAVVWRNRELGYAPVHGNGGTPVVFENLLIFSCDGAVDPFVVALEKTSGQIVWKTPRETDSTRKFSFSTPTVIVVNGREQLISPGSDAVCAFDPRTGREIWRVRYDGYSVIPKPVFGHGLVYVCTGYNRPSLLAIRPDGTGDVTETHVAWKTDQQAPHTPSLQLVADRLFMVSDRGVATCLNAVTGEEIWQERVGGGFSASPVSAAGRVYFQNEDGEGIVIDARGPYRELSRNPLGERTLASYAFDGERLYIRTDQHLFAIGSEASRGSAAGAN